MRPAAGVARALALAAVACGPTVLAGCGGSHQGGSHQSTHAGSQPANTVPARAPGTLHITPARPTTRSAIAFRFTAPVASGVHGHYEIGYSLSVTGTARPGCVGAREATAPRVAKGAAAAITLGPSQLGQPWCRGRYSARAIELQRAHCTGGTPCPQYFRVVAIVGRGRFDVTH